MNTWNSNFYQHLSRIRKSQDYRFVLLLTSVKHLNKVSRDCNVLTEDQESRQRKYNWFKLIPETITSIPIYQEQGKDLKIIKNKGKIWRLSFCFAINTFKASIKVKKNLRLFNWRARLIKKTTTTILETHCCEISSSLKIEAAR